MWLFYSLITLSISIFSMNFCRVNTLKYFFNFDRPKLCRNSRFELDNQSLDYSKISSSFKTDCKNTTIFYSKTRKNIFFLFLFLKLAIQTSL